ncbi:hypothetical protein [Herbiconiux sp. YIM B11900]|uniref:hypothetical protein n=1 Tax=Herbiconiux sp. YIM B11900 TaxID=3404131 RepID=UPI003F836BBA
MSPYAGPEGLWNADPSELAARLFVTVYSPLALWPLPERSLPELQRALASLGGYAVPGIGSHSFLGGQRNTQPLGLTIQLVHEVELLWERAGIAARSSRWSGSGWDETTVVMLRAGTAMLAASDPVADFRARLAH